MSRSNVKFNDIDEYDYDDNESIKSELLPEEKIEKWDVFEDPPLAVQTGSTAQSKWFDRAEQWAKVFMYIFTFSVVLLTAVVSKGTLLFMTSQIRPNITRDYCSNKEPSLQFFVTIPEVERVAWIWVLFFVYCVPQAGTFIRSMRICFFKTWEKPEKWETLSLFITESLPTIGSAILVFAVLPELDVVKGAMLTNAVCFVPGFIGFISRNPQEPVSAICMILDILSLIAQISSFVVWPLIENKPSLWLIPVSVMLISVGWWENYVSKNSPIKFIKKIGLVKETFENSRYYMYAFLSVWKSVLFFVSMIVIIYVKEGQVKYIFTQMSPAFNDHYLTITEIEPIIGSVNDANLNKIIKTGESYQELVDYMNPLWVFIINIASTYACYAFGKFACKIMIQRFSFAFPLNLVVPVTISGLIAMCGVYNNDKCAFRGFIPVHLFFESPPVYYLRDFLTQQHAWIWLIWLLSQTWITAHIWYPRCAKLARTEVLFVRPMFDPFLIDQDVALNRRRDEILVKRNEEEHLPDDTDNDKEAISFNLREMRSKEMEEDSITRIYACGTMWHETKEEMMEFLKSILRLDADQHARKVVKEYWHYNTYQNYYELETHIFFDDAFLRKFEGDPDPMVNNWVKMLVEAVDEAASKVHETNVRVKPPRKYITPYGGRLEWTLPGKTKMVAHLKDKMFIRPKKRWSQVMYMYYLLGHRLMEREDLSEISKTIRARNTFILALDGDIDFQPNALHLLVDLMKKNYTLGAACGRIHPIGSGPMVWYQMFEYAVGHWLQKATEHVIGCVLCSPGCFSLFRAEALMDKNVMRKYTTRSMEPMHYVQYDQGEDRWLCTLLLQRGYRVEYSAASDAYTHCPEKFGEFYNQRRRWMPSTTANILDLLMDAKRTIKINDNISIYYIIYQIILMVGTVLGPGTIFLMLVGAFVAAFQTDQWTSFLLNCIPILLFMFVCFMFKKDKVQLFFAGLISAVYGLIMMAVLVGVMLQINTDGILAPSSLFFFCVAGEFIITALLHPKEINCLVYGIVYYVTVPSMYMLLVIYSVFNMNNVSWGTREVTVIPQAPQGNAASNAPTNVANQQKKEPNKILSLLNKVTDENKGAIEFSLAGLFKCLWCTHKEPPEANRELMAIKSSLDVIMKKLDIVESQPLLDEPEDKEDGPLISVTTSPEKVKIEEPTDAVPSNKWVDDEDLLNGEVLWLQRKEIAFWRGIIEKYLYPIDDTKDKKRIQKGLIDLRDKAVFTFFMLNSLFVLVVFLLTLKKDLLHINWPLDVKRNISYVKEQDEIRITNEYLELEPIGFVFLIFFALLLVVQFIAMIMHRFETFSQIMATTKVNFSLCKKKINKMTQDDVLQEDPLVLARELQKFKSDSDDEDDKEDRVDRRKTVHNLLHGSKKKHVTYLDEQVQRRFAKFQNNISEYKGPVRRETMAYLARRSKMVPRPSKVNITGRPSTFYRNEAFDDYEA